MASSALVVVSISCLKNKKVYLCFVYYFQSISVDPSFCRRFWNPRTDRVPERNRNQAHIQPANLPGEVRFVRVRGRVGTSRRPGRPHDTFGVCSPYSITLLRFIVLQL